MVKNMLNVATMNKNTLDNIGYPDDLTRMAYNKRAVTESFQEIEREAETRRAFKQNGDIRCGTDRK